MFKQLLKKAIGFSTKHNASNSLSGESRETRPLSTDIEANLQSLREIFDLCSDIMFREFRINADPPIKAFILYVDGLSDPALVSNNLVKNLMETQVVNSKDPLTKFNAQQVVLERVVSLTETKTTHDIVELVDYVLAGFLVLVMDGSDMAILASVQGGESRAVDEPDTEPVVRGPRDGFVESLRTNTSLLRRRVKSSRLKIETYQVGALTKTTVAVCYLKGIANDKVVEEVKQRITRIKTDSIMASGYIEEFITDQPLTLFPLVQTTERPDKAAASILEGRVALIVDTTPMTLVVPCTFVSLLQSSEDYYISSPFATFARVLRFFAVNIALLLPAVVVAAFSFHQELLPTPLLNTIANARQDLPFPIFVEVMLMELTFELLREAGVRMPKTIGQAVSTVGGLVIGQAAVNAGFVAPLPVIVVAITAVASFSIPNYATGTAIRVLRFLLIILAGVLGGVGIMLGLMVILIHLCGLRSFGVPYLSPVAPLSLGDLKDTLVRVPWWAMLTRPRLFGSREPQRQEADQGPAKPGKGGKRP